jgi:nicotinamidase-related amidase/uncharacterized glyoxalase superfamily protein PhnB
LPSQATLTQLNLVVDDMQATLAFYRRLGLTINLTADGQHASAELGTGMTIEFDTADFVSKWDTGYHRQTRGSAVIGFALPTAGDVDRMFTALASAGHRLHQPPYDAFWGARYAIVDDPDSNPVGLMSPAIAGRKTWPPSEPPVAASLLLLVDVQRNMLEPPAPVPDAATVGAEINVLLERARSAGAAVVHVRNNGGSDDPDAPGTTGWQLIHQVGSEEAVVDKHEPNAFSGTNLADLIAPGTDVVIAGMQSDYCIRETSLAAIQQGHSVTLVRGAHSTYDSDEPAATIQRRVEDELQAAGARIVDPGNVRFA